MHLTICKLYLVCDTEQSFNEIFCKQSMCNWNLVNSGIWLIQEMLQDVFTDDNQIRKVIEILFKAV